MLALPDRVAKRHTFAALRTAARKIQVAAVRKQFIEVIHASHTPDGMPLDCFAEGTLAAGVELAAATIGTEATAAWLEEAAVRVRASARRE